MFAAVAEFERAIMLERQRAGVARARAEGKYKGRPPAIWHHDIFWPDGRPYDGTETRFIESMTKGKH